MVYSLIGGVSIKYIIYNQIKSAWPRCFIEEDMVLHNGKYFFIAGVNRFIRDIEVMLGFKMVLWWKICWLGISPVALFVSIVDFSL